MGFLQTWFLWKPDQKRKNRFRPALGRFGSECIFHDFGLGLWFWIPLRQTRPKGSGTFELFDPDCDSIYRIQSIDFFLKKTASLNPTFLKIISEKPAMCHERQPVTYPPLPQYTMRLKGVRARKTCYVPWTWIVAKRLKKFELFLL